MSKSNKVVDITDHLRKDILDGAFRTYNRLPTKASIAKKFDTTNDTVSRAFKQLEVEGLLRKIDTRTFEVMNQRERITANDETFRDYMDNLGHRVTTEHIRTPGIVPATPDLAKLFRVPQGTLLIERARREIVDGIIYRYSQKYYRSELLSSQEIEKIRKDHTFNVRKIIDEKSPIYRIQECIVARAIGEKEEAETLGMVRGATVMEQTKINFDESHNVLFVSRVVFNARYFVKTYDYAPGDEPKLSDFV